MTLRANDDPRWICGVCGGPVEAFDGAAKGHGVIAYPCRHDCVGGLWYTPTIEAWVDFNSVSDEGYVDTLSQYVNVEPVVGNRLTIGDHDGNFAHGVVVESTNGIVLLHMDDEMRCPPQLASMER